MHLIVTGGSGSVGRITVQTLVAHGHDVLIVDRLAENELSEYVKEDIQGARYQQADVTDYDDLRSHFDGVDAIIHLAGLPSPRNGTGPDIFHINARGTFNVYQAAADTGIKRVVCASSINALGFNYGVKPSTIQYFPIDEEHPNSTTDAYSFSKEVLEQTADYFWRRDGISGVCLRFPFVRVEGQRRGPRPGGPRRDGPSRDHKDHRKEMGKRFRQFRERMLADLEILSNMPEAERNALMIDLIADFDAEREKRRFEYTGEERRPPRHRRPSMDDMPIGAMLVRGRTNFWAIIDGRDAAQALEKGVLADYEGSHALFVNGANNTLGYPSAQLAAMAFPEVTTYKHPLQGTETLVSIEKARALIGFEPEYEELMAFVQ